jgi:hypothetical protein
MRGYTEYHQMVRRIRENYREMLLSNDLLKEIHRHVAADGRFVLSD